MIWRPGPAGRRWIKRLLVAAGVLLVAGIAALETARVVAHRRGVASVDLPQGSEIRRRSAGADYTDAYQVTLPADSDLDQAAFGQGTEVFRDRTEVVWEGRAPGLRFLASYRLEPGPPRRFTLSTAVFYESAIGAVYFFPTRYVHRRGVPYMVSRMAGR